MATRRLVKSRVWSSQPAASVERDGDGASDMWWPHFIVRSGQRRHMAEHTRCGGVRCKAETRNFVMSYKTHSQRARGERERCSRVPPPCLVSKDEDYGVVVTVVWPPMSPASTNQPMLT